jgi:hypothetical protein
MEHESLDRRRFLERAAVLLPAMHVGGFAASAAHGMTIDQAPATSPQPARIARLRLSSHAVPKMASFYRDTLGLPVAPIEGDRISVTCGETVIEFAPAPDGTQPFYHFAFNIPHNKLDKAIQWMKPRHPLFVRDDGNVVFHFERWDAHAVYFIDPSGNVVEFIARHTLKNDAPSSFDVGDILCASEIGVVTPDVDATADRLKRDLGLNSYKLAFDGKADNPHLPDNYVPSTSAYTGTHDNATTRGWYEALSASEQQSVWECLGRSRGGASEVTPALVRLAWESVAALAIAPLQDLLNLGNEARMNVPGRADGNWRWRCTEELLSPRAFEWLRSGQGGWL